MKSLEFFIIHSYTENKIPTNDERIVRFKMGMFLKEKEDSGYIEQAKCVKFIFTIY